MPKTHKEKTMINYKKAVSHIERIMHMTEENRYCIDIIQQNMAVIGLLKSANNMLMKGHLNSCFYDALKTKNATKQEAMTEEVLRVMKMSNK